MSRKPLYVIEITHEADAHLTALTARERRIVLDCLEARLAFEPTAETRNRKRLRPNPVAPWELRLGHLRIYFEVLERPKRIVRIQAVGAKVRNRVLIGGEAVELK